MDLGSSLRIESWMFEIVLYLFFALILWSGRKVLGREKTSLFLWGSLLWTLTVENIMVIKGAYDYFAYADYYCWADKLIPGFSGWACMVLFVPLSISLGWFIFGLPAQALRLQPVRPFQQRLPDALRPAVPGRGEAGRPGAGRPVRRRCEKGQGPAL